MSVKLFGQFLIDQGEVDASHVREALLLMEGENASLAELAICRGFMTRSQALSVSAEQRNRDLDFAELAVELGFLTPDQLVEVRRGRRSRRLRIGEALVRRGAIQRDRLGTLLDAYKADQAQYEFAELAEVDLPDDLASHPVTHDLLELLPRLLMRVARLRAKLGEIREFDSAPDFAEVGVSVSLEGVCGLEVALVSDLDFAEALAIAVCGTSLGDLDLEMIADGVGEFLTVLGGHAASATTRRGHRVELGPPDYEAELCDGWSVDLAVGTGRAALVLRSF
ncbi:MAG: hypothetical protein GY910_21540 [bacterium]|nr:hypothetical protein [Deltaproteobacteria bacterium]MCP4907564.1 hypothetical protein [bacterium]